MQSLLLLSNPSASGLTGGVHRDVLARLRRSYDVESAWPDSPEEARALASAAALAGTDLVVAFGGDGVVHHVANGLFESQTALGVIPAGTTNVFARILRIPTRPVRAAEFLAGAPPIRPVPVAQIQLTSPAGPSDKRIAVFAAGAGIDAEIVELAEQEPYRKYRFGSLHYARTSIGVVWNEFRDRKANMRVHSGARAADAVGVFVQIHSKYTYFGPIPLRLADHRAGALTALVVEEARPRRLAAVAVRAAAARNVGSVEGSEVWTGLDRISVTAEPPAILQADGEILGPATMFDIWSVPDALLVAAPR